jgi:hypothetical protein
MRRSTVEAFPFSKCSLVYDAQKEFYNNVP